jgi:DNA mismatch endonuclease (patch repair protein)
MMANRAESALERDLRSALHRQGLRFRKNFVPVPDLRCKADVAFPRAKVAVFVHGCFWHRCPMHGSYPKANAEWWAAKLDANAARDRRNREALEANGWTVVELWEHQELKEMVDRVIEMLASRPDE